jgi:RNA polymerase sigma-70 factor, ECF subfamily
MCCRPARFYRIIHCIGSDSGGESHSFRCGGTMSDKANDEDNLVSRALEGDEVAFQQLFEKNRSRLKKTIACRMDRRLAPRIDASDIIQETYLEAVKRWPRYIKQKTMPFYLWLRWIARERIIDLHRHHLGAGKRAITREVPLLPTESSASLAITLLASAPTPSRNLAQKELADMLHTALGGLDADDRELILAHDFEGLTIPETAQALSITDAAAQKRYTRALDRLRRQIFHVLQKG